MKTKEARPLENKRQHEILTTSTRFFMGLLFYVFNAKTHKYDSILCVSLVCFAMLYTILHEPTIYKVDVGQKKV